MATEIEGSEPITMADLAQLVIDLHAKVDLMLQAMHEEQDDGPSTRSLDDPAPDRGSEGRPRGLG